MDTPLLPVVSDEGLTGFRRSRDDAAIAGVCFSLAQRLRIDPLLVRLAAVILALSSGFGVMLSAAAWFLVPQQGTPRSLAQQWFPQLDAWPLRRQLKVALGACVAGCLVLTQLGGWSIAPGIVLLLLVVLARRWKDNTAQSTSVTQAPAQDVVTASPAFLAAVQAWQRRLDQVSAPTAVAAPDAVVPPVSPATPPGPGPLSLAPAAPAVAATAVAPMPAPQPRTRPRRSWLLGLLLLVAASLAGGLVPTAGVADPRQLQHAVALAVLGGGLVLAWLAKLPRPRLAVLAGLLVIASALAPAPTSLQPVDVTWTSAAQLPAAPVRVVATEARYDLSGMDLSGAATGTPKRLAITAQAADVELVLPRDAVVRVDYHLRAADLEIEDESSRFTADGGRDGSWTSTPGKQPSLVVDLTLTAASGQVRHA